jgi:hypothetical protein
VTDTHLRILTTVARHSQRPLDDYVAAAPSTTTPHTDDLMPAYHRSTDKRR